MMGVWKPRHFEPSIARGLELVFVVTCARVAAWCRSRTAWQGSSSARTPQPGRVECVACIASFI